MAREERNQLVSLEDALQLTGVGRFTCGIIVFCGFLIMGMILETLGFGYVLPGVQCDLDLKPEIKTWVAAVPFVGFIVTSHAWGWAADKWGRRRAMLLSTSLGCAFSLLPTLAPSLPHPAPPLAGFIVTSHAWGWAVDKWGRRRAMLLSTSLGCAFSLLSTLAPSLPHPAPPLAGFIVTSHAWGWAADKWGRRRAMLLSTSLGCAFSLLPTLAPSLPHPAPPLAGFIVTSHAWGWAVDKWGRRRAMLLSTSLGCAFSLLSTLAPSLPHPAPPLAGFIVTSHAWGWAADKWGRRRAMLLSMSLGCTFSLLSTLAPSLPHPAPPLAGFILTSHAWGWAADKWGRRRAMLLSTSLGCAFSLLSTLAPSLPVFVSLRLVATLFIAGGASLSYVFLGEMCPRSIRDTVMPLGTAAAAVGTGVVPALAWCVLPLDFTAPLWHGAPYRPWRLLLTLFALPYLICSVVSIWVPESPKFLSSAGRDEEALEVLRSMYAANVGRPRSDFPVESLKGEATDGAESGSALATLWQHSIGIFKPPLLKHTALLSYMQFGSFGISNGYYIWLPDVMTKMTGAAKTAPAGSSEHPKDLCTLISNFHNDTEGTCYALRTESFTVAICLSVVITAIVVGSAFSTRYLGKRNLILGFTALVAVSCVLVLLVSNVIVAVAAFSALQLTGLFVGLVNAFSVQVYPTRFRAMGVCMTMMFGRVGSLVATKVLGLLLAVSCPSAFVVTLLVLALMFVATLLLPRDVLVRCAGASSDADSGG